MNNRQLNLTFEDSLKYLTDMIGKNDKAGVLSAIKNHPEIDGVYVEADSEHIKVNILSAEKDYASLLQDLANCKDITVVAKAQKYLIYTITDADVNDMLKTDTAKELFPTADKTFKVLFSDIPMQLIQGAKLEFGYNSFVKDTLSVLSFQFKRRLSIAEALWFRRYIPEDIASVGQDSIIIQCNGSVYILNPEKPLEHFKIEPIFENIKNVGDINEDLDHYIWYWKWNGKGVSISEEEGVVIYPEPKQDASTTIAKKIEKP